MTRSVRLSAPHVTGPASRPAGGILRPREQVVQNILPPLSSLGSLKKPTLAFAKTKLAEIEAASDRGGIRRTIQLSNGSNTFMPDGVSPRGAVRIIIEELLHAGFYNIVYQLHSRTTSSRRVLLDERGWKLDGGNGRYASTLDYRHYHENNLTFDIAGPKRFDVDWETSALLSRSGGWREFIEGRDAILRNANGML